MYRIDLHPSTGGDNYIDVASCPFEIPLGALLPQRVTNLIPAGKTIGTTHITNGCYRLHPVEWNIGEVAGLREAAFARSHVRFDRTGGAIQDWLGRAARDGRLAPDSLHASAATVLALPMYLLASELRIVDTFWAVFIPLLTNPFGVYLARVYDNPFAVGIVLAAVFIVINYSLSRLAVYLESRMRQQGTQAVHVNEAEEAQPA